VLSGSGSCIISVVSKCSTTSDPSNLEQTAKMYYQPDMGHNTMGSYPMQREDNTNFCENWRAMGSTSVCPGQVQVNKLPAERRQREIAGHAGESACAKKSSWSGLK